MIAKSGTNHLRLSKQDEIHGSKHRTSSIFPSKKGWTTAWSSNKTKHHQSKKEWNVSSKPRKFHQLSMHTTNTGKNSFPSKNGCNTSWSSTTKCFIHIFNPKKKTNEIYHPNHESASTFNAHNNSRKKLWIFIIAFIFFFWAIVKHQRKFVLVNTFRRIKRKINKLLLLLLHLRIGKINVQSSTNDFKSRLTTYDHHPIQCNVIQTARSLTNDDKPIETYSYLSYTSSTNALSLMFKLFPCTSSKWKTMKVKTIDEYIGSTSP